MEIRELRYFMALAEELHFARAAARIGIEQSPLSKAITEMERRLGVRLFIRTRRSTSLTAIGETLLRDARCILAQVDSAHDNLLAAASGRRGRLNVAVCDGVAHHRLACLLAAVRQDAQDAAIQVRHVSSSEQLRGLSAGQIDVGFSLSPGNDPQLRSFPVWKDSVIIVMRADPTSSGLPGATWRAVDRDLPLILLDGASPLTACLLSGRLKAVAGSTDLVEYVSSFELLLTMVTAGYGIGAISAAQAKAQNRPELIMRSLDQADAVVTTFMIHRNDAQSALAARFTAQARTIR